MDEQHAPIAGSHLGDAELRRRLISGDGGALEVSYDVHAAAVCTIARRISGNDEAAQEITQDVFLHLWENPAKFDPRRGRLRTYLVMMAHRRAVDWVRAQVAREAREVKVAGAPVASAPTAEDRALANVASEWARHWLRALPPDQRRCIALAYIHGLTFREVADRLSIPLGTAKSRIRLGLKRLNGLSEAPRAAAPVTAPTPGVDHDAR